MAGQINIAGTSGSVQLFGNDTIVTDINIYFPPAGGLLFANGNALEATDGTFSGSITTEGSISTGDNVTGSGTTQGIHLANNGNSYFTADGATQKSIAVYQTGNTTPNAYIQTDGSITAAGGRFNVLSSGNVELDKADGTGVASISANDGSAQFAGGGILLKANGNAEIRSSETTGGLFQVAFANNSADKAQYEFTPSAVYIGDGITKDSEGTGAAVTISTAGLYLASSASASVYSFNESGNNYGVSGLTDSATYSGVMGRNMNVSGNLFIGLNSAGNVVYTVSQGGSVSARNAVLSLPSGDLDVGDRLKKADDALKVLKTAAAASSDFASLKAAIASALANI